MILINLLPHREEKRQRRKKAFFAGLGMAAVAGAVIVGIWYVVLGQMTAAQQDRNAYLAAEIKRLEGQIKDIANLRAEIEALKARQQAVENLQTDRNIPVYLLNEIVKQTPEGVYLTTIRQTGAVVSINGVAQTNERVSEFLRNALYNSQWLEKPELVEIKAAQPRAGDRDASARADRQRLFDFSLRVSLKRPQGPEPAASAPGGAGKKGKAPAKRAAAAQPTDGAIAAATS